MPTLERILGIDFGSTRIGIAVSDPMQIIAKGIGVVLNGPKMMAAIKGYVTEYAVSKAVVGMPLNLKGEMGQKSVEVDQFIQQLVKETGLEVIRWDERFTSKVAHQTLIDMGVGKKKRRQKGTIDEMAAALILQSYLDSRKYN